MVWKYDPEKIKKINPEDLVIKGPYRIKKPVLRAEKFITKGPYKYDPKKKLTEEELKKHINLLREGPLRR